MGLKADVDIDFTDVEDFLEKNPQIDRDLFEANQKTAAVFQKELAKYPPGPPGSQYVRTFTLGKGWDITKVGDWGFDLRNKIPYVEYVQLDKFQAAIHRGRWRTLESIIAGSMRKVMKFYDTVITR